MAYVDQAFSITDDELMMDDFSSYTQHNNRPPIKEIALAVSLLVFGTMAIVSGIFMSIYKIGDDRAHGIFFAILGSVLFIPGFYYTRIAYYAYKGYKALHHGMRRTQKRHRNLLVHCRASLFLYATGLPPQSQIYGF